MDNTLFNRERAVATRRHIVENCQGFWNFLSVAHVSAAVVNASDSCALSCPHCLYSAAVTKKKAVAPSAITFDQAVRFVQIMNEASLEHLIFSGGGESYENLPVMCYMLEHLVHLKQVVTVTSGYFATTPGQTTEVFDQLVAAIQRGNRRYGRGKVEFILRLSYDNSHDVPLTSIVNAINYALSSGYYGVEMKVVIRTLLNPKENKDVMLAEKLGGTLLPIKDNEQPTSGMPIIDGFPTRWIEVAGQSLPVIYKPTYFEGMAYKSKSQLIPGTSWQEIKAVEERFNNFFNLSLRGAQGQGHNFYQTVLKGYGFWTEKLEERLEYVTPRSQSEKGYSVYLPADGRLFINASAPDSYLPVTNVLSWNQFFKLQERDPLQNFVISVPTDKLVALAREVEPQIDEIIDRRNFVFSLAYTSMETPAIRLYLTIRLLQHSAAERHAHFTDPLVRELVSTPIPELQAAYKASDNTVSAIAAKQSLFRDPIIGQEETVYL